MISIESTGKTVQKAIEEGLVKLNKSIDEVDINIISSGGLFKKAKVEITVIETEEEKAKRIRAEEKAKEKPAPMQQKPHEYRQERVTSAIQPQAQKPQEREPEKRQDRPMGNQHRQDRAVEKVEQRHQDRPMGNHQRQDRPLRQDRPERPMREQGENGEGRQKEVEEKRERPRTEVTDDIVKQALEFVENLLKKMEIEFALHSNVADGELTIGIECESGTVIGYRGETLDSIEYLCSLAVNKCDDKYYRINIDCNDYRAKRVETLSNLARRMADKAVKTGRKVILEPMSSSSRKIIHSILSTNDRIITRSEGKDPNRRIIIIPKRYR